MNVLVFVWLNLTSVVCPVRHTDYTRPTLDLLATTFEIQELCAIREYFFLPIIVAPNRQGAITGNFELL